MSDIPEKQKSSSNDKKSGVGSSRASTKKEKKEDIKKVCYIPKLFTIYFYYILW